MFRFACRGAKSSPGDWLFLRLKIDGAGSTDRTNRISPALISRGDFEQKALIGGGDCEQKAKTEKNDSFAKENKTVPKSQILVRFIRSYDPFVSLKYVCQSVIQLSVIPITFQPSSRLLFSQSVIKLSMIRITFQASCPNFPTWAPNLCTGAGVGAWPNRGGAETPEFPVNADRFRRLFMAPVKDETLESKLDTEKVPSLVTEP